MSALLIGNASYEHVEALKNPVNDANDIAKVLGDSGFSVILKTDSTNVDMDRALKDFGQSLVESDIGLFFFAGHGMQIDGENYLAAVNTDAADESAAKYSSMSLNRIIEVMEKSQCATSIIVLDACRNNPFERAWSRSIAARGLAPVYAPKGTLIAYATSPGQLAGDGLGRNGAYTDALLQHISTPDCSIEDMFKRVRNTLSAATKGKQISWEHTSLSGQFFFNLSLGARIDIYDKSSLGDKFFILDESKPSHQCIKELKSLNWHRQNAALDVFTNESVNRASLNSLFVVGRNIYQAACGGSKSASIYLKNFASNTVNVKNEKRKALLDGMIFEIFYGPDAMLRKDFKMKKFQDVFELQQHEDLQSSFDFVAECLLPEARNFYSLPGKQHAVTVDVITVTKDEAYALKSLHCNGQDILWLEDEDYMPELDEFPDVLKLRLERFEHYVAEQMVVPHHLLKFNYPSLGKIRKGTIEFPIGWTARKK
jgi:hypothetical protein